MIFIGEKTGEIADIARRMGIPCKAAENLYTVIPGEALWIAPRSYPEVCGFSPDEKQRIGELVAGGSRVLAEYDLPVSAEGMAVRRCTFERLVIRQTDHPVTSRFRPLDLLEAHQAYFQHADTLHTAYRELASVARVSGFDTADFGLPDSTFPALVEFCASDTSDPSGAGALLWASTSISCPAHRRYKPIARWTRLLEQIVLHLAGDLRRAAPDEASAEIHGSPITDTNREEKYRDAISSNLDWYHNAEMLIDSTGTKGVLEGLHSKIEIDGSQVCMLHEGKPNERADCNIQSALAFLSGGAALGDERHKKTGKNLLQFSMSNFQYRDRSVYSGLWRWFRTGYEKTVFYSDDNGWAGFLSLFHGALSGDRAVIESGLQTAVALRETWGANGHRRRRIDLPDFYALGGRRGFREEAPGEGVYKSPHYEASAMATLALASVLTGDPSFVAKIAPGLDDYMEKWPAGIVFQHSENDDGSKFVTALLFAAEATGDRRYADKAREILQGFIDVQLECGAIPDIDSLGNRYGKNRSNADYGTFESSLFQKSSDLVTDQVYGTSFLLLALYFTGVFFPDDRAIEKAKVSLADYLVRIQIRDSGRAFLDGGWMRGFDPVRWEYYGAAGDWGYGPYLLETGWCQAIIVLGLSWILNGEYTGDFDEAAKEYAAIAVVGIEKEQREIEENWREHTPKPEERIIAADVPDVMI